MNRGEIWWVRFEPGREGDEMRKQRPAVIVNDAAFGRLRLRVVVPLTAWNASHDQQPWLVPIEPNATNCLDKKDSADAFQVTAISTNRFVSRIGYASAQALVDISAAIALVVGHQCGFSSGADLEPGE